MANLTEVKVPDIGDASGVDIIEVLVNVGDEISVDDGLIVLETDKATMEVPASDAGVVKSIEVKVGDKVSEGDLILKIEANESSNDDASASDSEAESTEGSSSGDSSDGGDLSSSTEDNTKQNTNQPKKSGGSRSEPITIPDIGDSEGVEVIEVSVKAGDEVEEDDSLIVLETEKATMEVPSPFAGTVESMSVKVGDKVSQGDQIGTMKVTDDAGDDSSEENANEQASEPKAEKETSVKDQPMPKSEYKPAPVTVEPFERSEGDVIHASPAVRSRRPCRR